MVFLYQPCTIVSLLLFSFDQIQSFSILPRLTVTQHHLTQLPIEYSSSYATTIINTCKSKGQGVESYQRLSVERRSNNNNNNNDPSDPVNFEKPLETIQGGSSEIFLMARRMIEWNQVDNSSPTTTSTTTGEAIGGTVSNNKTRQNVLPRWHPFDGGVSDANPSFRSKSPTMNNKGYANLIRRNSRKRSKASLWRHAYRTYNKMKKVELQQREDMEKGIVDGKITIQRQVPHFEAALVACAKLGLWREALVIYKEVVDFENQRKEASSSSSMNQVSTSTTSSIAEFSSASSARRKLMAKIVVTDNMILSIVSACVRGAKSRIKTHTPEEQRVPLDAVREILLFLEHKHGIPLVSRHVNPLAAAYQKIGLFEEGSKLINTNLADRITQAEDKEEELIASFNVNDVQAKDEGSYNILVQGAVTEGNWASAISSLKGMTEKGMYPTSRNLNTWSEVARKRERRSGSRKTSWMKNRERLLMNGTIPSSKSQKGSSSS
mmetsp:Transcript_14480/g.17609  ORF Transcript_14480/g.17609 Transcript_14480/m.17609 type:complete len:493 (-) Transcript_14480:18-1496(-)